MVVRGNNELLILLQDICIYPKITFNITLLLLGTTTTYRLLRFSNLLGTYI